MVNANALKNFQFLNTRQTKDSSRTKNKKDNHLPGRLINPVTFNLES